MTSSTYLEICHYRSYNLCVLENLESLPKLSQLEESFTSMLELHCVDTDKEMRDKDDNYLSSLESCGSLATIGTALQTANYLAESLSKVRSNASSKFISECLRCPLALVYSVILMIVFRE